VIAATGSNNRGVALALWPLAAVQGSSSTYSRRAFSAVSQPAISDGRHEFHGSCALLYPLYSMLVPLWARAHDIWPWLLPPIWFFAGIYNSRSLRNGRFCRIRNAWPADAERSIPDCLGAWGSGSMRVTTGARWNQRIHSRRPARVCSGTSLQWLEEERAISAFTFRTLGAVTSTGLFLATYLSVGLAVAILFANSRPIRKSSCCQ